MTEESRQLVEGTAVAIAGAAVLLTGPSGSGKSDLALRLIGYGGQLISDDLVELRHSGGFLFAVYPSKAPASLRGMIEIRGLGICNVSHAVTPIRLLLVVSAAPSQTIDRLPDRQFAQYGNVAIETIRLSFLEASAPDKVRLALARAERDIIAAP